MTRAQHPVETYLQALWAIRGSGAAVPETSGYGPFQMLLDSIGGRLSPKVRCIIGLRRGSAGLPDAGLFTADQFPRAGESEPRAGQLPARGVIEIKSTADDVLQIARTPQVLGYLARYGLVLVTNYRDFVLVERAPDGTSRPLERYALAASEAEFWRATPRELAERHGEALAEYLTRVMLHAAPLRSPKDVAFLLASYARDARSRVEAQRTLPALAAVRSGLEQGLGTTFEGERGEHFFRSTLVQTLFYGVFSAWVLWHTEDPGRTDRFTWRLAGSYLHLPVLQSLFAQLAQQARLRALGLLEVLDWTDAALARIERANFFTAFVDAQAVQYFYEPFLEAFDPELRRQLGVWYTPTEIVQYQVARVDAALRSELGIADGLADRRVYVLDPCCGTGAYLVEVVNTIAATLRARGDDDLLGTDLARAVQDRIFGFELLPAPFVVAHLQIGLLLQRYGASLSSEERAAIYLTNALTGWEPPAAGQQRLLFPELEAERDAAARIKREVPILVILGNPPYYAFGGVSSKEEGKIVDIYKEGLKNVWKIRKYNLDELYIRFMRLAERRIVEGTGTGIVCYISNASYLSDPSFVILRQRFLNEFDSIWIDDLHGDSRETGKLTPDGNPDPSVFSTERNREGIQLGTAIGLFVRKNQREENPKVYFRDFWGTEKRLNLIKSLSEQDEFPYKVSVPKQQNRFSFRPIEVTERYSSWPLLVDFCDIDPISGLQEMRRGALMSIDREILIARMRLYLDPQTPWEVIENLSTGLSEKAGGFDPKSARLRMLSSEKFDESRIMRYGLQPFDTRWCYYSSTPPLWNRARPNLFAQVSDNNMFIVTRVVAERPHENVPMFATKLLPDYHMLRPNVVAIPVYIHENPSREQYSFFDNENRVRANLSSRARDYLKGMGFDDPDSNPQIADMIWMHAIAMCFSPAYIAENGEALRQNWPRIPLPVSPQQLRASAILGRQIAALIDVEQSVEEVTTGILPAVLLRLARLRRLDGSPVQPATGDLALTAGWGYAGRAGITMPGRGRVSERPWTDEERAALGDVAAQLLGGQTLDVWLNERACWRNVPAAVWEYTIGGYQVVKKWLSYREQDLLGRDLTPDEARLVTQIVRRIAALLLLGPELDANYRAVSVGQGES